MLLFSGLVRGSPRLVFVSGLRHFLIIIPMREGVLLFTGYDEREAVGYSVFCQSVIKRASKPVAFIPLSSNGMSVGSNSFTASRFLVPYLAGFEGHAIFVDGSDMLCLGDIAQLDELFDSTKAVQVVKHETYISRHERKYVGTSMECVQSNYPRKNWASVMIMNCAHPTWSFFTPGILKEINSIDMLQFKYFKDEEIGDIPQAWNVLVDENQPNRDAKILHYTAGIPTFPHYKNARRSKDWFSEFEEMTQSG